MASAVLLQRSLLTAPALCCLRRLPPTSQFLSANAFSSGISLKQSAAACVLHMHRATSYLYLSSDNRPRQRLLQGTLRAAPHDEVNLEQLESATKWILDFAAANFLPLALITGVVVGLAFPNPGQMMQQWGISRWTTSAIFVISGLMLKSGDVVKASKAWPAALFGVVTILFITPLAAIPVLHLRLAPRELVTGLAIFCCVPTTLSSGVSLTQLAGGNAALALALTITSNLLGILTMPWMLSAIVGRSVGVSLPAGSLMKALVETLLVPLLLGKLIRELSGKLLHLPHKAVTLGMMCPTQQFALPVFSSFLPPVCGFGDFLDKRKQTFSILSSFLLSLVPWMQTSCSREVLLQIEPTQLLVAIACGICIHAVFLAWNSAVMCYLPAYWGDKGGDQVSAARAVIIVASQKTLPVLVAVVARLGGAFGEAGLLVLPCIATHLTQIICDSMLVSFWLNSDKSRKASTA